MSAAQDFDRLAASGVAQEHSPAERAALLLEAFSYIDRFRGKRVVVKYGGVAQNDPAARSALASDLVLLRSLGMWPVVVHGGGSEVSRMMQRLNLEPRFIDGLRVTDSQSMEIVEMVLSGRVNKELAAEVHRQGGKAVGISGRDGGPLLSAEYLPPRHGESLGQVGHVRETQPALLEDLLRSGCIPVVSPVAAAPDGAACNVNADSAAAAIAIALHAEKIIFLTDVPGIIREGQLLSRLHTAEVCQLLQTGVIYGGMRPKVEAALLCLEQGVPSAHIVGGLEPHAIITELFTDAGRGTWIYAHEPHKPSAHDSAQHCGE